jgi:hypothetical protein
MNSYLMTEIATQRLDETALAARRRGRYVVRRRAAARIRTRPWRTQ